MLGGTGSYKGITGSCIYRIEYLEDREGRGGYGMLMEQDRRLTGTAPATPGLPLIVPLVLYQGADLWQYEREFAELFANAAPEWRWVPRFEHLLIDQTEQEPGVRAGSLGREARADRDDGCVSGGSGGAAGVGDAVDGGVVPCRRIRGSGEARGVRAGHAARRTPGCVRRGAAA